MPQERSGTPVLNHFKLSTGGQGDLTDVSTRPTTIYGIDAFNNSTGIVAYMKLYNISTGISSVTSTAGTPDAVYLIPAAVGPSTQAVGGGFTKTFPRGLNFRVGLSYSLVTGVANNSTVAVGANVVVVNIQYDSPTLG